jgi:transposase InsO family protein
MGKQPLWAELAALDQGAAYWVHWFNHHRLLAPIGYIPPAEAEANYWQSLAENQRQAA